MCGPSDMFLESIQEGLLDAELVLVIALVEQTTYSVVIGHIIGFLPCGLLEVANLVVRSSLSSLLHRRLLGEDWRTSAGCGMVV